MSNVNMQSPLLDIGYGLLSIFGFTIAVALFWIHVSETLAGVLIIFGSTGIGFFFMATRPRMSVLFIFLFVYAGFGTYFYNDYMAAAKGDMISTPVEDVLKFSKATRFDFTSGKLVMDIMARKTSGRSRDGVWHGTTELIFPYVPQNWKSGDTIAVWAVYKSDDIKTDSKMTLVDPGFRQAIGVQSELYRGSVMAVVKKQGLNLAKDARILMFVDNAALKVTWLKWGLMGFFGGGSLLWIIIVLAQWWGERKERAKERHRIKEEVDRLEQEARTSELESRRGKQQKEQEAIDLEAEPLRSKTPEENEQEMQKKFAASKAEYEKTMAQAKAERDAMSQQIREKTEAKLKALEEERHKEIRNLKRLQKEE